MENLEEKLDPFVVVGAVFEIRLTHWGRLEQFIKSELKGEVIFVKKVPKGKKLKVVEGGEVNNGFSP